MKIKKFTILPIIIFISVLTSSLFGEDWPMWRYDAGRTNSSPQILSKQLNLQWVYELPMLTPCWEDTINRDRMSFDTVYEPVLMENTLFIASSRSDKVLALSTKTGEERWRFYADAPVRFPPIAAKGKIYFTSDDGFLYCLNASTGHLIWKVLGGIDERTILGNSRLISIWPARGGPVLADNKIYFAASIWPFMGIFIKAVDAETGKVVWENSGNGQLLTLQPHTPPSFASLAPQGALAISGDKLYIPNGRARPSYLDLTTGRLLFRKFDTKKLEGGSHVSAIGKYYFNHRGLALHMYEGNKKKPVHTWERDTYPLLTKDILYLSGPEITAYDMNSIKKLKEIWKFKIDATGALIKSGDTLYAGGKGVLSAVQLMGNKPPKLLWTKKLKGDVKRIITGDDRLFAVTLQGQIYVFGKEKRSDVKIIKNNPSQKLHNTSPIVKNIIKSTGIKEGYCILKGLSDKSIIEGLIAATKLHIIAFDDNEKVVDDMRRTLDKAALYGVRASVHKDSPKRTLPPYLASLIILDNPQLSTIQKIYNSLRPYGGVMYIQKGKNINDKSISKLLKDKRMLQAKLKTDKNFYIIKRVGPLPGSAPWTHQYGDVANRNKSDDARVKLPLGLLWFGGNSHADVLPRHGHGAAPQIIGGRLFIEGINCLSARDVYTGRPLWTTKFKDLGTFDIYYNDSYKPDPFDTSYNQLHIAGANARGTNFVATEDTIYLLVKDECVLLNPSDGKILKRFSLPVNKDTQKPGKWSYIGIYKNYLIAGSGINNDSKNKLFKYSSSMEIVVMDRHTGEVKWSKKAKYAFRNNTIIAADNTIFCIDTLTADSLSKLKRKGKVSLKKLGTITKYTPTLYALDIKTGKTVWENSNRVFGSWLGYSLKYKILVESGRNSRDMLFMEPDNRIRTYNGATGKVLWDKKIPKYLGPCMLHGKTIYFSTNSTGGAVELLTGNPLQCIDPISQKKINFSYRRYYGCNGVTASENLLTFRSGAAGYYDLQNNSGTGNLGGFKSSCTSNLIAADGVLNAPDYTRTCTCSYQNQTSLALISMPDLDFWTFSGAPSKKQSFNRLGINFGAVGDRMSKNGILWLEYPTIGGPSPEINIQVTPSPTESFRFNSSKMKSDELKWVAASGIKNVRKVKISLSPKKEDSPVPKVKKYTIRLIFTNVENSSESPFSIKIQDNCVRKAVNILKESGGEMRAVIYTFKNIKVKKDLDIEFSPAALNLAGIELKLED